VHHGLVEWRACGDGLGGAPLPRLLSAQRGRRVVGDLVAAVGDLLEARGAVARQLSYGGGRNALEGDSVGSGILKSDSISSK